MQSICAIFSQYAGLTLSLSSGECGPVGAKHAGILPSPVPAVPQPPPPAPQRRARRGSQDLRQDQWRQQARGLRLDEGGKDRWSIKNQRRATLHKETYRRREGRGEGWDPVIPDGGAPLCSHLTFPWNTLSLTPFYCQSYAVKYDCKSLWHPVSPSMIHCEKPDTHTHLFKPHAEISPPRPHLWTQEETDYWDRLLISPQMIPLHLFFSHFSFLFLWFSLLQKTSKKKNKKKMPANEKHHWGDVTEISVTAFFRIAFKVHSQKLTALLWTRSA